MTLEPLLSAPWHVQLHAFAAMAALGLGLVQFAAPKGTIPHRAVGYAWVALMGITAITAIFIRNLNDGSFSWIHLLIPVTLYGVIELSMQARRGLTTKHRGNAILVFVAALIVPGAFSFMPGRLMWQVATGG
jgi:uncharacterized membrane protein